MNNQEFIRFKQIFQPVSFNAELEEFFKGLWVEKNYPKGTFITEAGAIERYFYVVKEGVQMLYIIDSKGEKAVMAFSYTGDVSGVLDSFIKQRPSNYFLEALTPTTMWCMNLDNYNHLFERYPEFYVWARHFLEGILVGRGMREVEILTMSAKERYTRFMRRCPPELLEIPQKYLASYLNMAPETFSRLRASVRY